MSTKNKIHQVNNQYFLVNKVVAISDLKVSGTLSFNENMIKYPTHDEIIEVYQGVGYYSFFIYLDSGHTIAFNRTIDTDKIAGEKPLGAIENVYINQTVDKEINKIKYEYDLALTSWIEEMR